MWRGKRERRKGKGGSSSGFKNISKICEALYPLGGKKRMHEIEHLPSFPANLSYARGQWKMHLVRFSRSARVYVCVCVCVWWGTDRGVESRERNELLAETGAKAERLPLYESLGHPPPWIYRTAIDAWWRFRYVRASKKGRIPFENRRRNKFKYRSFFDMLTRIVEERPRG